MGERFDGPAIERTQPGPTPTHHDPAGSLSEHVGAQGRLTTEPFSPTSWSAIAPQPEPVVWFVHDREGTLVTSYPQDRERATQHARTLRGFLTWAYISHDFRE